MSSQTLEQSKEILGKTLYIFYIQRALKETPSLWETFSHEKQVGIHKIKAELKAHFEATN